MRPRGRNSRASARRASAASSSARSPTPIPPRTCRTCSSPSSASRRRFPTPNLSSSATDRTCRSFAPFVPRSPPGPHPSARRSPGRRAPPQRVRRLRPVVLQGRASLGHPGSFARRSPDRRDERRGPAGADRGRGHGTSRAARRSRSAGDGPPRRTDRSRAFPKLKSGAPRIAERRSGTVMVASTLELYRSLL